MNDLAVLTGDKPIQVEFKINYLSAGFFALTLFIAIGAALIIYKKA